MHLSRGRAYEAGGNRFPRGILENSRKSISFSWLQCNVQNPETPLHGSLSQGILPTPEMGTRTLEVKQHLQSLHTAS